MPHDLTIRLAAENLHVDNAPAMRQRLERALADGNAVTVDLQDAPLSAAYVRDALAPPLAAYGSDRLTFRCDDDSQCFVELAARYARQRPDDNDPEDPCEPETYFIIRGIAWNCEIQPAGGDGNLRLHLEVFDPHATAWRLAVTVAYADDAIEHTDRAPTPGWTFNGTSFTFKGATVHAQDVTRNRTVAVSDPAFGRVLREVAEAVTDRIVDAVDQARANARQASDGLNDALAALRKGA